MINPYSEGNQFAPNAPPPYAPEAEHMNYSHIKYVTFLLFLLLSSSYIPGFLSIGNAEWQPSLMVVDVHFKNTNNGRTLYFGWDSIYNYEQKKSIDFTDETTDKGEVNDDLAEYGSVYLNFTLCSLILIVVGSCISCCYGPCKGGALCFIRLCLSLLCFFLIIYPIIEYIIAVKNYMENDYEKEFDGNINFYYKMHLGSAFYANFFGLLLIPVIHLLMYIK